jgi:hypothetical protein
VALGGGGERPAVYRGNEQRHRFEPIHRFANCKQAGRFSRLILEPGDS